MNINSFPDIASGGQIHSIHPDPITTIFISHERLENYHDVWPSGEASDKPLDSP